MIKREDFQIEVGCAQNGAAYVRIVHLPTNSERRCDGIESGEVGQVRDRFLRELIGELYNENDFKIDVGRASGGDFLRLVHLPSGKSRRTCPVGRQDRQELIQDMLDSILEELAAET